MKATHIHIQVRQVYFLVNSFLTYLPDKFQIRGWEESKLWKELCWSFLQYFILIDDLNEFIKINTCEDLDKPKITCSFSY